MFDITFLVDRTKEAVNEVVEFVNNNLLVLDENGKNMIVSEFHFDEVSNRYDW